MIATEVPRITYQELNLQCMFIHFPNINQSIQDNMLNKEAFCCNSFYNLSLLLQYFLTKIDNIKSLLYN